jgi:hypothetical protein
MRWPWRRIPHIQAPTNVRIHWSDIGEEPVDCFYEGWDGQTHVWVIQNRSLVTERHYPMEIRFDALPGKTSVEYRGVVQRGS